MADKREFLDNIFDSDRNRNRINLRDGALAIYKGLSAIDNKGVYINAFLVKAYRPSKKIFHPHTTVVMHVIYGSGTIIVERYHPEVAQLESEVLSIRSGSQVVIHQNEAYSIRPNTYLEMIVFTVSTTGDYYIKDLEVEVLETTSTTAVSETKQNLKETEKEKEKNESYSQVAANTTEELEFQLSFFSQDEIDTIKQLEAELDKLTQTQNSK